MKKIFLLLSIIFINLNLQAQTRPIINNLNVFSTQINTIKLTWDLPQDPDPKITGILILKDTKQISSYDQLNSLKPIATLASDVTEYVDKVNNTTEYYYAVITVTEKSEYKIILPSINATIIGVRASNTESNQILVEPKEIVTKPVTSEQKNTKRKTPLPQLKLTDTQDDKKIALGPKAIKAANTLGKNYVDKKEIISEYYIFEQDLICPESGDGFFLFRILKDSFIKKDFATSIVKLEEFLNVHRSKDTNLRALFYLGQSYYFVSNYEKAIFNFLQTSKELPELSQKWLDSSLDLYELE